MKQDASGAAHVLVDLQPQKMKSVIGRYLCGHHFPYLGAERHTTTGEERRDAATTASITSTLLGIRLLATTADLAAGQRASGTLKINVANYAVSGEV